MKSYKNVHIILFALVVGLNVFAPDASLAEEHENTNYSSEVRDPYENINRRIFGFNNFVDKYLLEPVAIAYDYVLPNIVQDGVTNFFENIQYPVYLLSDVVQGKFNQAGLHTSRFLINSTIGVAGILDPANEFGLREHQEDFGTALAYHGVGDGPYLMLPFIGPSNLRDGLASIVDRTITPTPYIITSFNWGAGPEDRTIIGTSVLEIVNRRAQLIDAIDSAKSASVDYYLFVRSAYKQSRDAVIYDGVPPEDPLADDDMGFEDEFEDEFEEE